MAKDVGAKADTKADTEASATVPAGIVPGTAARVQAGSAGRIASGIAGRRSPEGDPDSTITFARRGVDDAPSGTISRAAAEYRPRR